LRDWIERKREENLAASRPGAEFNGTMMQYWYTSNDGRHWNQLRNGLAAVGISAIWFPPTTERAPGGWMTWASGIRRTDLGEFVAPIVSIEWRIRTHKAPVRALAAVVPRLSGIRFMRTSFSATDGRQ
jgi:hypothetical protein